MNNAVVAPIRSMPVILCAMDLESHMANAVETDCFAPPETDCACPSDGTPPLLTADIDPTVAYALPALHTDALPGDWVLAFNPQGAAGVVVLDQAAWMLLDRFRQPRRLVDAADEGDDVGMVQRGVLRLAGLGLIERVDRPSGVQRKASETLTVWLHITNACNLRCD